MADPILETRHLRKEFGGLVAVDDVSLQVAPGSLHAIIGPNGAGKTTLFNLLSGRTSPKYHCTAAPTWALAAPSRSPMSSPT
jgi:branched-chain amino acid transport system ATP-binding protein